MTHQAPDKSTPDHTADTDAGPGHVRTRRPASWRRRFVLAGIGIVLGTGLTIAASQFAGNNFAGSCKIDAPFLASVEKLASGNMAAFGTIDRPHYLGDLNFLNENGQRVKLADFSGKLILMNLWASWCAPCRHEMPTLDALAAEFSAPGFEVVTVNLDNDEGQSARAFLAEIGAAHLPAYRDPDMAVFEELRKRGRSAGLPATLLIDRNGCEIGALNGPADWASPEAFSLIAHSLSRDGA